MRLPSILNQIPNLGVCHGHCLSCRRHPWLTDLKKKKKNLNDTGFWIQGKTNRPLNKTTWSMLPRYSALRRPYDRADTPAEAQPREDYRALLIWFLETPQHEVHGRLAATAAGPKTSRTPGSSTRGSRWPFWVFPWPCVLHLPTTPLHLFPPWRLHTTGNDRSVRLKMATSVPLCCASE